MKYYIYPDQDPCSMEGYFCFICIEAKFPQTFFPWTLNNFSSHLRNIHNVQTANKVSSIPLICMQNGCSETFTSFANFRYHLGKCSNNWRSRQPTYNRSEEIVVKNFHDNLPILIHEISQDTETTDDITVGLKRIEED